MAFPWSRSRARASPNPVEGRRRARRARRNDTPRERSAVSPERMHQRLSWAIGGLLILLVVAVLAAGYYEKFYRPPTVWAGKVRDVQFTMGDLVRRIRVEQGLTGTVNLATRPFEYLQRLLHAEILRQEGPRLGIEVTEELTDRALRSQFYPEAQAGQTADPGQLDREYRNNLQIFVTRAGLSEAEYRGIVAEQLRLQQLYILLSGNIEESAEQVEVEWIRLEVTGEVNPDDVAARLDTESFAAVAQDVGVFAGFASPAGYVGWVPHKAFPEIGRMLFGDEQTGQEPLEVGAIGRPLFTGDGIYIVHKLSGPETRPLSNVMRAQINAKLVEEWEDEILKQGTKQGWVRMKFNSDLYSWVADQAAISAPRNSSAQTLIQPGPR